MAYDSTSRPIEREVVIIGAGFSGLGMGIQLREAGIDAFVILERAGDLGGTWRDNHYPGCACDIPSHLYCYSFAPNPQWSRTFAPQREIQRYLQDCAERYGLRPHLRLRAEVVEARYREDEGRWWVRTGDGQQYLTRILVSAMGALSNPLYPALPGLSQFAGTRFHSAEWKSDYDLRGKRVAVIGTGASAIQFVPQIATQVAQLDLYQRTPPWVLPKPDRRILALEKALYERWPAAQRVKRTMIYWELEMRLHGFVRKTRVMRFLQWLSMHHLRKHIADPQLRALLTPDYDLGCKRMLISNDYYPALARDNVAVVGAAIGEVRAHSIVTADGRERPVDALIFATGFQPQDPVPGGMIFGRGGLDLRAAWRTGPQAYLGTAVSGFPNLFMLMGPNTGLGHNSMIYMIEAQIHYVLEALRLMRARGLRAVEVRNEVQQHYNKVLQQQLSTMVWSVGGCHSWYLSDAGHNTTQWPGHTYEFKRRTEHFVAEDYRLEAEHRVPV